MTHPSSLELEAFAVGERSEVVVGHLENCKGCAAFVDALRSAVSNGPARVDIAARIARASASPSRAPAVVRRAWTFKLLPGVATLAAAAVFVLVVKRGPSSIEVPRASWPASPTTAETATPGTTFKGAIQTAVIRERGKEQSRFTGRVTVREGDRLRLEVALDREQAVSAAVLGDDGSWTELMSEAVRGPGTHFSERSVRVEGPPSRGTILVGGPEAVGEARRTKRFDDVVAIHVEWDVR